MIVHFAPVDLAIIGAYLVFTIAIGMGLYHSRGSDPDDYLVAGRTVTLPAFVATLVSTWYGGILGVGEFSYSYGIANWVVFGLPYYVFAIIFALFLAKPVRSAALYTIPDRLSQHYGLAPAVIGSLFTFVMVSPAPYVLMLGVLTQLLTGWPQWICVVGGAILSIFYVATGGLRTDIRVNIFQFALMFLGFGVALPTAFLRFGGWSFLSSHLPHQSLTPFGGNSLQTIIVWFLIALWTLVDPGFHQRCYAAKTPQTARNGILVAICFWFVFDFMTTFTGLYARAVIPGILDPKMSYPLLAERILPPALKGLFFVGMLATVMSTVMSYTFLGAVTIGRDVIWRLRGDVSESNLTGYTRIGLIATAMLAVILAIAIPSVVSLWFTLGSICVPGLLAPVLGSYLIKDKMTQTACIVCMVVGFGTSLIWMVWGHLHKASGYPAYWFGLEPMIPGLAVSFAILLLSPKKSLSSAPN